MLFLDRSLERESVFLTPYALRPYALRLTNPKGFSRDWL